MTVILQVPDDEGLYATISASSQPRALMRSSIDRLGRSLAQAIRSNCADGEDRPGRMLCVVVLRGGALLYPSFAAEFRDVDFCMLGLRRMGNKVLCEYRTVIPSDTYDRVVYLDCVAATGGTLLEARRAITEVCETGHEIAAVICSATTATRALRDAKVGLLGFSLNEAETSGIVAPDLGKLDVGDLFTSTRSPPINGTPCRHRADHHARQP